MASLRRLYLLQMRDVLRTLGADWDVQVSGTAHASTAKVRAEVVLSNEEKNVAATESYACSVSYVVMLSVDNANASAAAEPAGDAGNPDLYMERIVELVEKKLQEDGVWGTVPPFTRPQVELQGWDFFDPGDRSLAMLKTFAFVRVMVSFEHLRGDPGFLV